MKMYFNNIKNFIYTSRYDKPHGILLLYYPCIWGLYFSNQNILEVLKLCIVFFLGSCGMRAIGCIWNDLNDKKFDILVNRTNKRLIATGVVSRKQAIKYIFINLCLGCTPLLYISKFSILLCFAVIPLVIIYPFMKRITWWPQLWLGITFNWGVLVAFYSKSEFNFNFPIILFYLGCIFWTIAYDTIYGYQDIEDDLKIGIKSTSIKFKNRPNTFIISNYALSFISWIISFYFFELLFFNFVFISILFAILITILLHTDLKNTTSCLKLFKCNSYFGFFISLLLVYNYF